MAYKEVRERDPLFNTTPEVGTKPAREEGVSGRWFVAGLAFAIFAIILGQKLNAPMNVFEAARPILLMIFSAAAVLALWGLAFGLFGWGGALVAFAPIAIVSSFKMLGLGLEPAGLAFMTWYSWLLLCAPSLFVVGYFVRYIGFAPESQEGVPKKKVAP